MSTFRAAVESKDLAKVAEMLHPDIVMSSPAVFKPYRGRDSVLTLLTAVFQTLENLTYTAEFRDADSEVLRFRANVGDKQLEGVDIISYADDGRVAELTVMLRPLSGLIAVAKEVGDRLPQSQSSGGDVGR
jgi:hypothetical protein